MVGCTSFRIILYHGGCAYFNSFIISFVFYAMPISKKRRGDDLSDTSSEIPYSDSDSMDVQHAMTPWTYAYSSLFVHDLSDTTVHLQAISDLSIIDPIMISNSNMEDIKVDFKKHLYIDSTKKTLSA